MAGTAKPDDRMARVSSLLRLVDEDVRAKKFDNALERIRKVYEYDIKNVYARAYEERVLIMMMEQEREVISREAQEKAEKKINEEVKRRLNDFYKQQEAETQKRKQEDKQERILEEQARLASVQEVQQVANKDINKIEVDTGHRIEELEKRLLAQIQQTLTTVPMGNTSFEQLRTEYETKLQQYKKQYEEAEGERKKIHDEAFIKFKEEQKRTQEELLQRFEEERTAIVEREQGKAKQLEAGAYQSMMKLMVDLAVPAEVQSSLLQALKITFSISDMEHKEAERIVQLSTYIDAIRSVWQRGKPAEEDMMHIKNLQQLFHISEAEHQEITKGVKKELGLPDDTAVLMVIDDDPSIRKYVEHILKKTYQRVMTAATAENALKEMEKTIPSLIISDINLGAGAMSGFTFYEKIVAGTYGEELKSVPFVLISSMEDEFFVRTAKQLGVKAYLPKPFTKESIETLVKNVLG